MTGKMITYQEATSLLAYDPSTGDITWRRPRGRAKAGAVAGYVHPNGYRIVGVRGSVCLAHRLAWLLHFGAWPAKEIDHKNANRDDNRISNLRECTTSQNAGNKRVSPDSASGLKGVYYDKRCPNRPWAAFIRFQGKGHSLGQFASKAEASRAYMRAAKLFFGEFARAA